MAIEYQCFVCGDVLRQNLNDSGFAQPDGKLMTLCGLHHEAAKLLTADSDLDWLVMSHATVRLNLERPSLIREPEKYSQWDPLGRLVELYRECLANPEMRRM